MEAVVCWRAPRGHYDVPGYVLPADIVSLTSTNRRGGLKRYGALILRHKLAPIHQTTLAMWALKVKLRRFRGGSPAVCAWQVSKTPAGADKRSEAGSNGLRGAFRSVWGANASDSGSSSNGVSTPAPRSLSTRQSRRGSTRTATQRARRGQSRSEQAAAKGQKKTSAKDKGRFYWNITGFPFPLGPLLTRRTVRYEVSHKPVHPLGMVAWLVAKGEDPIRS